MACACECLGLLVDYQQSKEGFDSGLQNEVLGIARNEATGFYPVSTDTFE